MSTRGFRILIALLAATLCARARAEDLIDEDLQAQLELWRESPLSLSEVSAEELARLPWLDWAEAEAIVGLRAAGALARFDDLHLVPGLEADRIEALRPFLELRTPAPRTLELSVDTRAQRGREPRASVGLDASWGSSHLVLRGRPGQRLRGTWMQEAERGRWLIGQIRPAIGHGLLLPDPFRRSRFAAVSSRSRLSLRPRTDSQAMAGFEGVGVESSFAGTKALAFVGRDPRATPSWFVAAQHVGAAATLGGALDLRRGERSELAVWFALLAPVGCALEWVGDHRHRRGTMRVEGRVQRWRLQAAMTAASKGGARGHDPIAGHGLDRPHRAAQISLRTRGDGWSLGLLGRAVWRGWDVAEDPARRVALELRGRPRPGLGVGDVGVVDLRAEWVQLAGGVSPEFRVRVRAEAGRGDWRRRVGWAWRGSAAQGASLGWAQVERGRRRRFRVSVAGAGGRRSSPWAVALPEASVVPVWLDPGSAAAVVGVGLRMGGTRLGVWGAWAGDPSADSRAWLGLRWEHALGAEDGANVALDPRGGPLRVAPARPAPPVVVGTVEP